MRRRPRTRETNPLVAAAKRAGVRDERVLRAVAEVSRSALVPAHHAGDAELDIPLPIPHDLVTTQPSLVARMVEALALSGVERVLEVGAGHGYQTALLAPGPRGVGTRALGRLAQSATANLARQGIGNARVVVRDGTLGLADHAPYDGIVAAVYPEVPRPLAGQLVPGGRLVQPVGPGGHERVTLLVRTDRGLEKRANVTSARFVRLLERHAFEEHPET